ncbi:MAG: MarR family transcriptional regulator [Acidimicrobiales bacterium]|nr:MarR family transcriptional regulator [Acidimicrobiales bacterium]
METSLTVYTDQIDKIIKQWGDERPDVDVSPVAIFGRIARINRLLEDYLADFLCKNNLTLGLFDVLTALRRSGEPYKSKPSELADMTMLTSGGMTGRLDQLEELGLVKRISDLNDRRVMFAQLTAKGLDLIDELIEEHFHRETELLKGIEKKDQIKVSNLLREIETAMTGIK